MSEKPPADRDEAEKQDGAGGQDRQCAAKMETDCTGSLDQPQQTGRHVMMPAAVAVSPNKTLQRMLAYATAAPATWGHVLTEAAVTLAAAIWMRVG